MTTPIPVALPGRGGLWRQLADVSLLHGWLPATAIVLTLVAIAWLTAVPTVRHAYWVGAAAAASILAFVGVRHALAAGLDLTEPVPRALRGWAAVLALTAVLGVGRVAGATHRLRTSLISCVAVTVVVAAALLGVNQYYSAYPTLNALVDTEDVAAFPSAPLTGTRTVDLPEWSPSPGEPAAGRVYSTPIPGTASGFDARGALVYLPPAYFTDPRPRLPVLVLLAGVPGSPHDWLRSIRLPAILDLFAARHHGVAPIVVIPDGTGEQWADPECVDSPLGNVSTYLSVDVPGWIDAHLSTAPGPEHRAIGGLSYGGMCGLQTAVNHPDVYRVFLNMSGLLAPSLGSHRRTLDVLFHGSEERFRAVNALDLLHTHRYPRSSGVFVVGDADEPSLHALRRLHAAAHRAGMRVELRIVPGGHDFGVWRNGVDDALPWIAERLGIR
ncbi:alpha/beta hydrolase [Gordonia shandongensis]|uniref:alpha/beta hydrolase n=1 Tax=Gordonia shandongensis TaxID=376351 RepID=UPI000685DD00|nr:alpha/beta hydrolase-fold protein [Gordonia shandongensis]